MKAAAIAGLLAAIGPAAGVALAGDGTFPTQPAGAPYTAAHEPVSIAVGDMNNDSREDLVILNRRDLQNNLSQPNLMVRTAAANGSFSTSGTTPVTGSNPSQVVLADFDSDGDMDAAVSQSGNLDVAIFHGAGNGGFQSVTSAPTSINGNALVTADFNNDGDPDLATADFSSFRVSVLLGDGNGGFAKASGSPFTGSGGSYFSTGEAMLAGDWDEDGDADLAFSTSGNGNHAFTVRLNAGNGTFNSQASGSPFGQSFAIDDMEAGDFNSDGHLDIATAGIGSDVLYVNLGDGDGHFTQHPTGNPFAAGLGPTGLAVGDFNSDLHEDLAVADFNGSLVTALKGAAGGRFPSQFPSSPIPVGSQPEDVAVGDFNRDGNEDFAAANGGSGTVSVRFGAGDAVDVDDVLSNGSAEAPFPGLLLSSNATPAVWTSLGAFGYVRYGAPGGVPDHELSNRIGGGTGLFVGGNSANSAASQNVSVSGMAAAIDASRVHAYLSGFLGGKLTENDAMRVDLHFLDAGNAPIGSALTVGPVTAADRNNLTTLLRRADDTLVPAGTRTVQVIVAAVRGATGSTYDNAYADRIALNLVQTPVITSSTPVSPANNSSPAIKGTAQAGSSVTLFKGNNCTNPLNILASGSASTFASPGIVVSLSDNSTTNIVARVTDRDGNESFCSAPFTYVEDSTGPATPTLSATVPASPSPDATPNVIGSAEAGSTVNIYAGANCSTGSIVATGSAATLGAGGLTTISLGLNTTTQLQVRATDAAGNNSACSAQLAYTHDSLSPTMPTIAATTPASPANDNNPEVIGSAEAGSTVRVYADPTCTGAVLASGGAASFGASGLTVHVNDNSSTLLRVTATDAAGNVSACSTPAFSYVEDSTGPSVPSLDDVTPDSPSSNNDPVITGTTDVATTVTIYDQGGVHCLHPVLSGVTQAQLAAGVGIHVADDSSNEFRATATDGVNTSACSGPLPYVEDSTPPAVAHVTGISPASPSNDLTPNVHGTTDAGTTITAFTNMTCTSAPIGSGDGDDFANPRFGIGVTVASNAQTEIWVRASDHAGNSSGCSPESVSYKHDSVPPNPPTITATFPNSPSRETQPKVTGTVQPDMADVTIYGQANCAGSPLATSSASAFAIDGIEVAVGPNDVLHLSMTSTDDAGNVSDCSAPAFDYINDSAAPAPPALEATTPASPSSSNTPAVTGQAEAGALVNLYATPDCSGTAIGGGMQSLLAGPGIGATVASNATTEIRATAKDAAGNTSACSDALSYVEDSAGPATPSLDTVSPGSPSQENSPLIRGSAEPHSLVSLFASPDCSGPPLATAGAEKFTADGFQVNVGSDSTNAFRASAVDSAGNASACSAALTYVEDSTAPETRIDSGPSGRTAQAAPSFDYSADAGASFECRLDSDAFAPCPGSGSGQKSLDPLPDGEHTFSVRATDAAGNVDASPASQSFTVATLPETKIDSLKVNKRKRSLTATFSGNDPGVGAGPLTFSCTLDRKPPAPCTSPVTFKRLKPGRHQLTVYAIGADGDVDATPAVSPFRLKRPKSKHHKHHSH